MSDVTPHGFVRQLLFLLSGPLVWFVHFSLIYGAAGFGGAFGLAQGGVRLLAWSVTLAAAATVIALLWHAHRSRASADRETRHAIREIARILAALSLVAIGLEALVLWVVPL